MRPRRFGKSGWTCLTRQVGLFRFVLLRPKTLTGADGAAKIVIYRRKLNFRPSRVRSDSVRKTRPVMHARHLHVCPVQKTGFCCTGRLCEAARYRKRAHSVPAGGRSDVTGAVPRLCESPQAHLAVFFFICRRCSVTCRVALCYDFEIIHTKARL